MSQFERENAPYGHTRSLRPAGGETLTETRMGHRSWKRGKNETRTFDQE